MKHIFQIEDKPYKLRHKFLVKRNNVRSVNYGTNTASFIGSRIWDNTRSMSKYKFTFHFQRKYKEMDS